MKINISIKKLLLIIGLLLILLTPKNCLAGGILYLYDGQKWNLQNFSYESYISYENGLQKIIIDLNFTQHNTFAKKCLIIFPFPCSLNDIQSNLSNDIPRFNARDLKYDLLRKIADFGFISNIFSFLSSSLFIQTPYTLFTTENRRNLYRRCFNSPNTLVKYKVSTELVSFSNLNQFKTYLTGKSITLDDKIDKLMNEYINNKYAFALSYFSNNDEIPEKLKRFGIISNTQLYFKFKSNKMYYPLKTASINNDLIEENLFIFGYKTPELYTEIAKDTEIDYYSGSTLNINDYLREFYPSNASNYEWTAITIKSNGKKFIKDLFIADETPLKARLLSSFFYFIYIPITSIFYIILAFTIYYLLFYFFGNKYIPSKLLLFLSILFFISHFFTFIYSIFIKLDQKLCGEENDTLETNLKTNFKTQNKLFITIIFMFLILILYLVTFFTRAGDGLTYCFHFGSILTLLWIFNKYLNTILINFYLLFCLLFILFNSIYQQFFYNFIISIF